MTITIPRPFRAGVNWMPERHKLYRFDAIGVTVIRPWPDPRAWRKDEGRPWRAASPSVELRAASIERPPLGWPHAFERDAWSQVPAAVRELVVPAAFAGRQWRALNLAARVPHARLLMAEVPMLAAVLAELNWLRSLQGRRRLTQPWRSARSLARRRDGWLGWVELAGALGLPADRAFVRVLRRVGSLADTAWSVSAVHDLAVAWAHPDARKLLLHLPELSPAVATLLSVATRDPEVISRLEYRLLADARTPTQQYNLMQTGVAFVLLRGHLRQPPPVPPLGTLAQLERARDRAAANLGTAPVDSGTPLPPPPLAGDEFVRPLQSSGALEAEGAVLEHCIGNGTWADLARMKLGYAYSIAVADGEVTHRGTLWIAPRPPPASGYLIEQIQGPKNNDPHPKVRGAARAWLARHRAVRAVHELIEVPNSPSATEPLGGPWAMRLGARPNVVAAPDRWIDDEIPF
jgi:hypothetical protein